MRDRTNRGAMCLDIAPDATRQTWVPATILCQMEDLLRILAVLALIGAQRVLRHRRVRGRHRTALGPAAGAAEAGSRRAQAALRLMDDPVRVISTVQVGITALGHCAPAR